MQKFNRICIAPTSPTFLRSLASRVRGLDVVRAFLVARLLRNLQGRLACGGEA